MLREACLPGSDSQEHASSKPDVTSIPTDPAFDSRNVAESMPAPEPIPNPVAKAPSALPESDPPASGAASGAEDPEITAERERAERLARIAVSEMILYSPEKFDAAIREQNLEQVMDPEIQEARALIRQRINEEVRAEKDFILEELERVAQRRSSQG